MASLLSLGSLVVGSLEILGFYGVYLYLIVMGIPLHPSSLQLLEFPTYALDILATAPPWTQLTLSALITIPTIVTSLIIMRRNTVPTVVYYRLRSDMNRFVFLVMYIQNLSLDWLSTWRVILAFCLFFAFSIALPIASAWANRYSFGMLSGAAPGIVSLVEARGSVHLIPIKGSTLPDAIAGENKNGALALIWQDDKTYYVAPIHSPTLLPRSNEPTKTWFFDWVAVERSQVLSLKYDRQLIPGKIAVQSTNSFAVVVVEVASVVYFLVIVLNFIRTALRHHRKAIDCELRTLSASELRSLKLSPETARAVLRTFRRGQDCILEQYLGNEIRRVWIRREAFPDGFVMTESDAETTLPAS